jgi:HK97 family phage prohead protease
MPEIIQGKEIEIRIISKFEIREADDGKKYIEGYAIRWNELSVPLGYYYKFKEQFRSGAFEDYLTSGQDTKMLIDHDRSKILGRSKKNTLTLRSDSTGLWYSLKLPETTLGKDSYEDVRNGNKEHISIGFKMIAEEWDESDENNVIRTVTKANLPEISLTGWPAYEQTSASTRSVDPYQQYKEQREKEKLPLTDYHMENLKVKLSNREKRYKFKH